MGYLVERVRKHFQWNGWEYAPSGLCECAKTVPALENGVRDTCPACTEEVGTGCNCHETCHCTCGIPDWRYAGDSWIVEEGHPRLEMMMASRFATPDAAIPAAEELLLKDEFKRLLNMPKKGNQRGPGRPRREPVLAGGND